MQAFLAVLDSGTTRAAADRLGLSQSAVSRRVSQLESALSLKLFIRDKTRLIPTREARFLVPHIRALVAKGLWLDSTAQDLGAGSSGEMLLRIAFPGSMSVEIVPRMLAAFLSEHDQTRIELHTGPYDTIERMIRDDRAEIGFVRLPIQQDRLRIIPLTEVATVCVMPKDHRLAAHDRVSLTDLHGEPMVLLGRHRAPRREMAQAFVDVGFRPKVRVEAHSVASACGLVAQGLGLTLVNELMAKDYLHLGLIARPLSQDLPHRFAFATPPELPLTQIGERFVAAFQDFMLEIISTAK